ncbi:hypothetical protein QTN25_005090 [Entamoeba marina]
MVNNEDIVLFIQQHKYDLPCFNFQILKFICKLVKEIKHQSEVFTSKLLTFQIAQYCFEENKLFDEYVIAAFLYNCVKFESRFLLRNSILFICSLYITKWVLHTNKFLSILRILAMIMEMFLLTLSSFINAIDPQNVNYKKYVNWVGPERRVYRRIHSNTSKLETNFRDSTTFIDPYNSLDFLFGLWYDQMAKSNSL